MVGNEAVVEGLRHVLEPGQLLAFHFGFLLGENFGVEGLFEFQQMPEDARQFVRHGGDRLGAAQSGFPPPV